MSDRQHQTPASTLVKSSYSSLGSPREVGKRFVRFLLSNARTVNALNRILIMDCNSMGNDGRPSSADSIRTDRSTFQFNQRNKIGSRDISLEINAFDLSELNFIVHIE